MNNPNIRVRTYPIIAGTMLLAYAASADFAPIRLTQASYNQDMVVERPLPATTATVDNGPSNTGATFYEVGYYTSAATTGLPAAGSTFTSSSSSTHSYRMAPSYKTNDVILIDSSVTSGTFAAVTPTAYTGLSFLVASGNGSANVAFVVHHLDGTTDTGNFTASDWFGGASVAYTANGRVNAVSLGFDSVNSGNPRLYFADVSLAHPGSPVTSITFNRVSGGHACIFAVSGLSGGTYSPIAVTGYNQDVIIEAGAQHLPPAGAYTTATMDNGTANTAYVWYAAGFDTAATATGLPAAGSTVASASALDHQYRMAPSYRTNNVGYVDATISANFVPATNATYAALSFLAAAGHGPILVDYGVSHLDGTLETGVLSVPDWYFNTPVAVTANGRVDATSGIFDSVNSGNPRLYSLDVTLANTTSPVTNVSLSWDAGNTTVGVAAFFAMSGTGGAVPPVIGLQPVSLNAQAATAVVLSTLVSGTPPLSTFWQKSSDNLTFGNLTDANSISGSATTNLTISPASLGDYGFYRVIASNALGSVTSSVARLNVVTSRAAVTAPGDPTSQVNGSTPVAEAVGNIIDGTTQKYLNFGNGTGFPPFVGPVGVVVTPSLGSSTVTGLRFYTANDSPERDPADFLLEGSLDGSTFIPIASGALTLPDDRNNTGQALDPINLFNQEVGFVNATPYLAYRLTYANVKNNLTANSAQIAEVEFLAGESVTLSYQILPGGQWQLSWPSGTLEEATSLTGPWHIDYSTTSPYTVPLTGPRKFYRVISY